MFSYNSVFVEALFWWNLEFIGRVVVCVKDRTAAGISGHLIGRHSWCEHGSGARLKSIETVSPEGTFCDTVQAPSNGGDMELI